MKLKQILIRKGYTCIKLKKTKTNHYEIKAKINHKKGRFILDTGASNSCVDFSFSKRFHLSPKDSKTKAAGAGAINMRTQQAINNLLVFKSKKNKQWKTKNFQLVLFDLTHVNTALTQHNAKAVHGIIGADILQQGKAIIDYKNNRLYLKRNIFKY